MSKLYNGSICLSDIPKEKITTSEKNGKKYLNINVWVNDELDQYGNIGSIQLSQSKAEREASEKKVYIGNIKQPQAAATPQNASPVNNAVVDDLPF
jgi:RNA recognition motif-containing protein